MTFLTESNFIVQSQYKLLRQINRWIDSLEKSGVEGIEKGNIYLNEFEKTPEGKFYNYLCFSIPQLSTNPNEKEQILQHPQGYYNWTKTIASHAPAFAQKLGISYPQPIGNALINYGTDLSLSMIIAASLYERDSMQCDILPLLHRSDGLKELHKTLHHGIYAYRNHQDPTPLTHFYALAQQQHLQPKKESIELLLN